MWPKLVDYTEQECKQMLRRLELEAYSSVVSALRAQGEFNPAKKKILQELSNLLSISWERHQAELRRAVNDERLTTIAYHINGDANCKEWAAEGRRITPLMSRLLPQTSSTQIANMAANFQSKANDSKLSTNYHYKSLIKTDNRNELNGTNSSCKRLKAEKVSSQDNFNSQNSSSLLSNNDLSVQTSSGGVVTKSAQFTNNSRPTFQIPTTLSIPANAPRVVFVSSNGSTMPCLTTSNDDGSENSNHNTTIAKVKIVQNSSNFDLASKQVIKNLKPLTAIVSGNGNMGQKATIATGAKISAKSLPQQVVVIPSGNQQKTITLPISQALKGIQVPNMSSSNNTAVLYQTASVNSGQLKAVPGTITIQTFKPNQGNKIQVPNLIILPAKAASNSKTISLNVNKSNMPSQTSSGVQQCDDNFQELSAKISEDKSDS